MGHLVDNPACGVELPRLKTVRPKWALTVDQAIALLENLRGRNRGRWSGSRSWAAPAGANSSHFGGGTSITQIGVSKSGGGVRGHFRRTQDRRKRAADSVARDRGELLQTWQSQARRTAPEDLIFSTVSGKPISPNNVLRTWVWPACQAADLSRVTWLTFRRTYSSWAHQKGVRRKSSRRSWATPRSIRRSTCTRRYSTARRVRQPIESDRNWPELARLPVGRRR